MSPNAVLGLVRDAPETSARPREVPVPESAYARSTLGRVDYADAFLVETDRDDRTGEEWARELLEGAPRGAKAVMRAGWFVLGLDPGPPGSERHVFGWELRRSTPDFALLGISSRLGLRAELVFEPQGRKLLVVSLVQHANAITRGLWAALGPAVHAPTARYLLGQVAARD